MKRWPTCAAEVSNTNVFREGQRVPPSTQKKSNSLIEFPMGEHPFDMLHVEGKFKVTSVAIYSVFWK